jgi:PAS domain S-box-containing protein
MDGFSPHPSSESKINLNRLDAEEKLRVSEERYHSLFSNMMDGFAFCKMIFDEENNPVDFVYLEVNDVFEKITGLKKETVVGKPVTKAIPGIKEANPELFEIYGRAASTGKADKFEVFFKPLSLWLSISVYCPNKGYFVAVFEDITERKKAEQEVWRAKKDWERTFECVPDFIAVLDNQFKIVRANHALAHQLGITPEKAVGLLCYQCVHGLDNPPDFCPHAQTVNDGKEHVAEVHEPRLGGDFLVSTTPLRDEKGVIVGSVHVARNITERKKTEEALSNLNRHLRAINSSNQALMHATDESTLTQDVCNIIIHDCGYALVWVGMAQHDKNKTVHPVAYAGFDKEYIDQLNVTWADEPRGRGPTGTVIRSGKPYVCRNMNTDPNFELWREQATKRKYTASLVLPLLSFEGKAFGALNIYSQEPDPFSEEETKLLAELANDFAYGIEMLRLRKEREEATYQLERYADQMEELADERAKQLGQAERLATIGQTAGMVGHDIRNPLQAIVGELYLAKDELNSLPDSDTKKNLQEGITNIEQNLFYIDKIVADLQDYTKPLRPAKENVEIEKIIEEALLIVFIPNNLEVSISIEEGFPPFSADFAMLKRALINLIQNAVQAMPNGGILEISAKRQDKQVWISIQDTGEGIPEEVQDKLFTPLFTTKSKGQGFGLAVVKRLIEAQDGKITFNSQKRKGTTFTMQLPIK